MSILTMLWKNFWGGPKTLRFPARPEAGIGFRGQVRFNPELCNGCAICKFRCTSRAITYQAGKGEFTWGYDPGQCTFCGRCVEGCKAGALSQDQVCPPVYTTLGELKTSYTVARKAPVRPAKPAPAPAPAVQAETPATEGAQ